MAGIDEEGVWSLSLWPGSCAPPYHYHFHASQSNPNQYTDHRMTPISLYTLSYCFSLFPPRPLFPRKIRVPQWMSTPFIYIFCSLLLTTDRVKNNCGPLWPCKTTNQLMTEMTYMALSLGCHIMHTWVSERRPRMHMEHNVLCGVIHHPLVLDAASKNPPKKQREREREGIMVDEGGFHPSNVKTWYPYMFAGCFVWNDFEGFLIDFGVESTRNDNLPYAYCFRGFFVGWMRDTLACDNFGSPAKTLAHGNYLHVNGHNITRSILWAPFLHGASE